MSSNNFIRVSRTKKGFLIQDLDIESGKGFKIGEADTFKKARDIAEKYLEDGNPVEYGIEYRKNCFND